MDHYTWFLIALGALIVALLLLLYVAFRCASLRQRCETQLRDIDQLETYLEEAEKKLLSHQEASDAREKSDAARIENLIRECSDFSARLKETQRRVEELTQEKRLLKTEFSELHTRLREEFSLLASRQLSQTQQQIFSQNRQQVSSLLAPVAGQIESLMQPLRQNISALSASVGRSNENSVMLTQQLGDMMNAQQRLSQEAGNLASALKNTKHQGCWGEVILEKCLENAGFAAGRDFQREVVFSAGGVTFRPDVILKLPDEQIVIIDSKCSMNAFVELKNAADPDRREEHLAAQIANITKQIENLGSKSYEKIPELAGRVWEFVIMFVPSDEMFSCCLEARPDLLGFALKRKVCIATPSTIMACLVIIRQLWAEHDRSGRYQAAVNTFDRLLTALDGLIKKHKDLRKSAESLDARMEDLSRSIYGRKGLLPAVREVAEFTGRKPQADQALCDLYESTDADKPIIIPVDRLHVAE